MWFLPIAILNCRRFPTLVTTVIHRLHEKDSAWWQETLREITAERKALVRGAPGADVADRVLARAIGIVEHALAADESVVSKQKHSGGA